jgi:hypothetical protein
MATLKLSEQCARCPREQERVVTIEQAVEHAKKEANNVKPPPALVISVDGQIVASYQKLCDECREIVTNYAGGATRKVEKRSSRRVVVKKKAKEEAKPVAAPQAKR